MITKPVAFDICCRKGGATKGLQRAGLYVVGFDIEPQGAQYPGNDFRREDGLQVLEELIENPWVWPRPDLIWQSWPCQAANTATAGNRAKGLADGHRQFIPRARELSDRLGIPYVLEQPTSSIAGTIRRDLTLCMDMFKGDMPPPWIQKHRSFEFGNWPGSIPKQIEHPAGEVRGGSMVGFPKPAGHTGRVRGWRHGPYFEGPYVAGYGKGGGKATAEELRHAMGIDWMTDRFDLCEAIPPVFAEYIGREFLKGLNR